MNPLCRIRDIQKALETYEQHFAEITGLSLKEGMLLCCLTEADCNATELANMVDLSCSNCSKVISSVEKKGFVMRQFGANDKRQMIFTLTDEGRVKINSIKQNLPEMPEILVG